MKPRHLSDLADYRKRQQMHEQLRREVVKANRRRVKAVGRHVTVKTEGR